MSVNTVLQAQHLKKYYRGVRAVEDVSFEVRRGEIFGFLGPNGAGKTTTIGMSAWPDLSHGGPGYAVWRASDANAQHRITARWHTYGYPFSYAAYLDTSASVYAGAIVSNRHAPAYR